MSANYNSKPIRMAKEYKQNLEKELNVPIEIDFDTIAGVLYAMFFCSGVKFDEIALIF
jgi:hypothetical protein